MRLPPLHTQDAVFSRRHAPTWMLLAFAAGAVNTTAFLACSRFVTHVTGTVTRVGMDVSSATLAAEYGVVLVCFVAGAGVAAALIEGRYHQHKQPLHAAPLALVVGVLTAVALLGEAGVFGTFGGSVEGPRDFLFLSLLSFAMGLQNAAVATSTGQLVRTTHMTGPATDLGVHLSTAFHAVGDSRKLALLHAGLRAGKIVSFTLGAATGVFAARALGYASLLVPAAIAAFATASSFARFPTLERQESST